LSPDSLDHFLFSCPKKLPIWQSVWSEHVDPSVTAVSSPIIQLALTTLGVDGSFKVLPLLAIAATLESIWSSHWAFIFQDVPFNTASVKHLVSTKFLKLQQETSLKEGIPHSPPPLLSLN
ncbi:hypothetical protein BDF21DRAFT_386870, partial [Thamnidium elegans]